MKLTKNKKVAIIAVVIGAGMWIYANSTTRMRQRLAAAKKELQAEILNRDQTGGRWADEKERRDKLRTEIADLQRRLNIA